MEGGVPGLLAAALRPASTRLTSPNTPATERSTRPAPSEPVRTRAPRAPPRDRHRQRNRHHTRNPAAAQSVSDLKPSERSRLKALQIMVTTVVMPVYRVVGQDRMTDATLTIAAAGSDIQGSA